MATFMYVSLQQEDRIAQYTLDPATGALEHHADYPLAGMPAPMAVDPQQRFLFVGRRLAGNYGLTGFSIQPGSGHLQQLNSVPLGGDPVHISVDRSGNYLLSAYYYQARVGVHGFDGQGTLAPSPIEWRETGIGAHYVQTDPQNRYAFVPHIAEGNHTGVNAIFQFRFDQDSGRLTPNDPDRVVPSALEGPRHFCFHPSLDVLYSSNEQGCSVTAYYFDPVGGTLEPFRTVPTLPDDFDGYNSCSQIQITPSGRFLYAPNRGHNSIAGFAVDPSDGSLTPLGQTATEPVPRAFSLDNSGNYLYATGLESGNLATYHINPDTGALEPQGVHPVGQGPMWVSIIDL